MTGGARGIGLAIAERYVAEGARVTIADIEPSRQAPPRPRRGRMPFVATDVGDARGAENVVAENCRAFGGVDILVNNAGIIHSADFLDLAEADFDRVLRVNLKGAFLVGQAAARRMVAQVAAGTPPGTIINMSSINAVVAIANQAPYCVSKGGIDQLTKVMALSLAPYGIRVNAIGPGSIMTDILKSVATDQEAKRRILTRTPARPHRRTRRDRGGRGVPRLARRELYHRPDHLCRRREAGAELHGAGEGRGAGLNSDPWSQSARQHWIASTSGFLAFLQRDGRSTIQKLARQGRIVGARVARAGAAS